MAGVDRTREGGDEAMSKELRCSFCYKAHADVKKLIAGPKDVAICDECVEVCYQIVAGKFDHPGNDTLTGKPSGHDDDTR